MPLQQRGFGIVLKTVERCNINCTYCYFFNSADDSFKRHPIYLKRETVHSITEFLKKGIHDLELNYLRISFHGGEPLMQKKTDFAYTCEYFIKHLSGLLNKLEFTIQTNGLLLSEEWLELLAKYKFSVGVSIDGPKEYNDKYRVDHSGRGTYDRLKEKIEFVKSHKYLRALGGGDIGALSVINLALPPDLAYSHLIQDLKFKKVDFLLPDFNYKTQPNFDTEAIKYGDFLQGIFKAWVGQDDASIIIRFCKNAISSFMGSNTLIYGVGKHRNAGLPLVTISSNGDLGATDELKDSSPLGFSGSGGANVNTKTLKEFLQSDIFLLLDKALGNLPAKCSQCEWRNICAGGGIANRYHPINGFDNPSVYCEGLKNFYNLVYHYMIKNGYPVDSLKEILSA